MKIYNLGSLNIDRVYSVDHFVSAGESISSSKLEIFPGGKGLNQSVALARAGADVVHGAVIGDGGDFLVDVMRDSGVDVSRIVKAQGDCGHAIIQVDKNGGNCIMIYGGTNRAVTPEYVEDFLSDAAEGDILLAQNETNCVGEAFEIAHAKGMTVAFNPSPFDERIYPLPLDRVGIWFCNEIEGAALTGSDDPDGICDGFARLYPESGLVLTLGASGSIFCAGGEKYGQAAYSCRVVDTTAAGDTFTGYWLAAVSKGSFHARAMDTASKAASIAVSRMGASASIPYIDEIGV